ncbi:Transmembrane emp24 domain-containing protein p24delta9 [Platanthera zijinensis]|uniref:Transmembrane emp24 domain-containing protein p24delta9 n=1 Tax=Platanthera zijinensis TaxID=2320716 RepID=A0AAP0B0E1_9ASPA
MGIGGVRSAANLCLLIFVLTPLSEALRFDVQSAQTKCISEDIKLNSMVVGKYSVVNPADDQPLPDSHKITVRVSSPYGNSVHYADHVDSGNFAFTSSETGDYLACFWTPDHKPAVTISVEFDWRTGVAAKDWTNVAKKGQIDVSSYLPFVSFLFNGGSHIENNPRLLLKLTSV